MRRTKLNKQGKTKTSVLKRKLWELCKQITRKVHGNICYTCGARNLSGSNWHTGHFITQSICSTELAYDIANLRPQCYRCNIHLSGNWLAFEAHMIQDGIDTESLKKRNQATKNQQYDRFWLEKKIKEYEQLYSSM